MKATDRDPAADAALIPAQQSPPLAAQACQVQVPLAVTDVALRPSNCSWCHLPLYPHLEALLAQILDGQAPQSTSQESFTALSEFYCSWAATLHTSKEATARITGVEPPWCPTSFTTWKAPAACSWKLLWPVVDASYSAISTVPSMTKRP